MTSPERISPSRPGVDQEADHGANLVFRSEPTGPPLVIKLPGIGIGLECPGFLHARGPVTVDGRTVQVEIRYCLDVLDMRYKVVTLGLTVDYKQDEIEPDLLRRIRWAEMAAPGLDTFKRVVVYGDDGTEERHRSMLTLSADQQTTALWLTARVGGVDPNKHIAAELGISSSAAAARVKRLREAKILPQTTRGQRR